MTIFNILAEAAKTNNTTSYILLGVLLVVLVGGFIWSSYSSRKRQKQTADMINKLAPGDKVKTIGGICGVIVEINDEENTFVLETGSEFNKSYIRFDRQAVYQTEPLVKEKQNSEEEKEEEKEEDKKQPVETKKVAEDTTVKEEK